MNVTAVRLNKQLVFRPHDRLKAVGSVELDHEFRIEYVKVIEVSEGRLLVAMPSQKNTVGKWADVCHPIKPELRARIDRAVLEEYARI